MCTPYILLYIPICTPYILYISSSLSPTTVRAEYQQHHVYSSLSGRSTILSTICTQRLPRTHAPTHPLTHPCTHTHTYPPTHPPTHPCIHTHTHKPASKWDHWGIRVCMSHVTHVNKSYHTHEWVKSHIRISHGTRMNESCYTYESVNLQAGGTVEGFMYAQRLHERFLCLLRPGAHANTQTHTRTHTYTQTQNVCVCVCINKIYT